jgi:hypothetical protein
VSEQLRAVMTQEVMNNHESIKVVAHCDCACRAKWDRERMEQKVRFRAVDKSRCDDP